MNFLYKCKWFCKFCCWFHWISIDDVPIKRWQIVEHLDGDVESPPDKVCDKQCSMCVLLKNQAKNAYEMLLFYSCVQIRNDKSRKNNNKMARISLASALATMYDAWNKENNLF